MGCGLKYQIKIMYLRVFKERLRIQQDIVPNNYQLKRSGPLSGKRQYQLTLTSVTLYVSGVSTYKNQF